MIERNEQHALQAVLKLAPAFYGKPRIASILVAVMRQVQDLANAIHDATIGRNVDSDDPKILATIGKIVGQERGPLSLEEFRTAIKARIRISRSHGRLKDLIEVLKLWGVDATITPLYPA